MSHFVDDPAKLCGTYQYGQIEKRGADSNLAIIKLKNTYIVDREDRDRQILREVERKESQQNVAEMSFPDIEAQSLKGRIGLFDWIRFRLSSLRGWYRKCR